MYAYVKLFASRSRGIQIMSGASHSRQLASASNDQTVRLWDAKTGAAGHILELDIAIHTLSFFTCRQHLQTNWGVLDTSSLFPSAVSHSSSCSPSLSVANNWVTFGRIYLRSSGDRSLKCLCVQNCLKEFK
jgi:WD40 repeat protein